MMRMTKAAVLTAAAGALVTGAAGMAAAAPGAHGGAANSPGIASGNSLQTVVNVPVNACGTTVNAVGGLNWTFGSTCVNH